MATVTGLTLVKRFDYRGDNTEEFSNTYHFKNPPPGDAPSWTVLMNDIVALERTVFSPTVTYSRAYGYDSNDDNAHHVFAHDFTVPGPPPAGTYTEAANSHVGAGDQASLVWWLTDAKTSKGKPVYLRKYFHVPHLPLQGDPDVIEATYAAALNNLAFSMKAHHGGLRSAAQDLNVVAQGESPYVTTRTLKRRGKRPLPKLT